MAVINDYATLQAAVADYLSRDDLTTFIPNFVQNAENKLYRRLNLRNEETALDIPIGGGVAAIPDRFKKLKYAYFDSSPSQLLEWRPVEDIYRRYSDRSASSTPCSIAREGNHFIFGPGVADGTLKGIYYQKTRSLETTSETTADEVLEDATLAQHSISQAVTLTDDVYTFSVYAKIVSGVRDITLSASSTNVIAQANFNLLNGTILMMDKGVQTKSPFIEALSNDWYRCSISFAAELASTTVFIYLVDTSHEFASTYTGDGTSGIYLWGAQLEKSPYPTEPVLGMSGVVDDDFKNRLIRPYNFNSTWMQSDVTVTADQIAPPLEISTPTQNWYTNNAPDVLLYASLLEAEPFIKNDARIVLWEKLLRDAVDSLMDEQDNAEVSGGQLMQVAS